jgi:hypothetical protein
VTVTRTGRDGTVTESTEAFTARDRQIVDEEVNSYLADAGVEQRPGGFRWFVRLPSQFSSCEEFRAAVTGAVYASEPRVVHPAEIAPIMKQAMQRLYARQEQEH